MVRRPLLELSVAVVAAVVSAEMYLRAESPVPPRQIPQYRYDAVLGWGLTPGAAVACVPPETVNEDGYRGPTVPRRKPDGVRRIVVLGDSLSEAFAVPWRLSYPGRLAGLLSDGRARWEVVSLATGAYGTVHEYLQLQRTAFEYEPDLVIVQVCWNDFWDNVRELSYQTRGPWADIGPDGRLFVQPPSEQRDATLPSRTSLARRAGSWLKWTSALAYRVATAKVEVQAAPAGAASPATSGTAIDPRKDPRLRHGLDVTARLLSEMNGLCRARGVAMGVYVAPTSVFGGGDYLGAGRTQLFWMDPDVETWLYRDLLAACQRDGVACVWSSDLLDPVKAGGQTVGVVGDPHWNALGHELVARDMARLVPAWLSGGAAR